MYCLAKQLHPPTAVEHSIYCNFYNDSEKNLVVAGGNQLKVFRLVALLKDENQNTKPETCPPPGIELAKPSFSSSSSSSTESSADSYQVKLECRQSFQLFGEISSISSVRLSRSKRDSLLVCFVDAKLSIVQYDSSCHDLKTLALHYFEEDELKAGLIKNIYPPVVRCDPEGRCAAMLGYGRNIIIIPFKKDEVVNVDVDGVDTSLLNTTAPVLPTVPNVTATPGKTGRSASNLNSQCHIIPSMRSIILPAYKLDLTDQSFAGEQVQNIIDLQFLEGYYEPTLLIVFEPLRTWTGRIAMRTDTCSMIALSLNIPQRVHPIIWSTQGLPYDCVKALPVPKPLGGVLLLACNSLIYLNQSVPPYAVSLNVFGEQSTSFSMSIQRGVTISLDCARACFLSNDKVLLSLKGGELYVVTLFSDGMRSVKRFHFAKAASSVISSCMSICGEQFLFLGSRLGNSLLLKYTEKIIEIIRSTAAVKEEEEEEGKEEDGDDEKGQEIKIEQTSDDDVEIIDATSPIRHDALETKITNGTIVGENEENAFVFDQKGPLELMQEKVEEVSELIHLETTENLDSNVNFKKRKLEEEIEFDDEDKELYGEEDPIFSLNVAPVIQPLVEDSNIKEPVEESSFAYLDEKETDEDSESQLAKQNVEPNSQSVIEKSNLDQEKKKIELKIEITIKKTINGEEQSTEDHKVDEEEDEEKKLREAIEQDPMKLEEGSDKKHNGWDGLTHEDPEPIVDDEQMDLQVEPLDTADNDQTQQQENNSIEKWMAGNVALMRDSEELEVYGEMSIEDGDKLPVTLTFEICDSIMNIGPCGRFCMGELSFLSEEFQQHPDPQVELVCTAGHEKNGALCVLQRSIRPQIVTTFVLPNCVDIWTVFSSQRDNIMRQESQSIEDDDDQAEEVRNRHAYMILSRNESTMVLETGQEINELDQCSYITNNRTVFAGNLHGSRYVLQVMPNAIRLIEGSRQVQHLPLELKSPIVQATLADPHCVVLTESGLAIHLHLSLGSTSPHLIIRKLLWDESSKATNICLLKDTSGLFNLHSTIKQQNRPTESFSGSKDSQESSDNNIHESEQKPGFSLTEECQDDLDELLYGDSDVNAIVEAPIASIEKEVVQQNETKTFETKPKMESLKQSLKGCCTLSGQESTYWLFVSKQNGSLEIYSIHPEQKLVFQAPDLQMLPKVLLNSSYSNAADHLSSTSLLQRQGSFIESNLINQQLPEVREIFSIGLGAKSSRSLLFVLLDEELCVYEAFAPGEGELIERNDETFQQNLTSNFDSNSVIEPNQDEEEAELYGREDKVNINKTAIPTTNQKNQLKIRYRKLATYQLQSSSELPNASSRNESKTTSDEQLERRHRRRLRPFYDINGYSGVFLCGPNPRWFFMGTRGELFVHEMTVDGPVENFAEFNNENCVRGFLYFNNREDLRIATLPTHLAYEADWPVRKLPIRCTVHFVNYHVNSKCYVVVTGHKEQIRKIVKVAGEEKDYEELERDESRYIWATNERFSLQLLSPVSWQMIAGTRIDLDEWEHVTCLKNVQLHTEGTETGYKGYVALGTNYCYGEDVTNKGRIWILDIVDVVPEPGQPLTKNKIKVVYCKEQKGPVTALTQVRGYLLSAIGQKIYIWQLKEEDLAGVAFIDTQIYIHSAVSIKNLILVADIYKSVSLLRYQEETKTLALVSKDMRSFEVYACEFMVDANLLCFLISDVDRNLILYSYQPEIRESTGGTRLIRRADFHLGALVNCFFRIRCRRPSLVEIGRSHSQDAHTNRHLTLYATLDGGLGYVLPVSEKIYRRLLMVQNLLNNHMQHLGGLNPKAFRLCRTTSKSLTNIAKNVLDGELLHMFFNLSVLDRRQIAQKIGTSVAQIKNDLYEIDRTTSYF